MQIRTSVIFGYSFGMFILANSFLTKMALRKNPMKPVCIGVRTGVAYPLEMRMDRSNWLLGKIEPILVDEANLQMS